MSAPRLAAPRARPSPATASHAVAAPGRARLARTGLVVLALVALGCGSNAVPPPSGAPDIVGQVTAVDPAGEHIGSIRVEAVPSDGAGSPKATVNVGPSTVVIGARQRRKSFGALAVGQTVRVWYNGPVLESYPVRAGAGTIVIDSLAR